MALTSIAGIGEGTAKVLAEHGIDSIKKLAKASVQDVMKVPGFGEIRAKTVLAAAAADSKPVTKQKKIAITKKKKPAKKTKKKGSKKDTKKSDKKKKKSKKSKK